MDFLSISGTILSRGVRVGLSLLLTLVCTQLAVANPGFTLKNVTDDVAGSRGKINANFSNGGALDNSGSCCQLENFNFANDFADNQDNAQGNGIAYGMFTNGASGSQAVAVLLGANASNVSVSGAPSTNADVPNGKYITATTAGAMSATVLYQYNGGWFSFTLSKTANSDTLIGSTIQTAAPPPSTPELTSVTRKTPASQNTNADSLVFNIAFSEDVKDVSSDDFTVGGGSTATVTNVAANSATSYDLTVSGGNLATFNGTVGLGFAGGQNITGLTSNQAIDTGFPAGEETYAVDNAAPSGQSVTFGQDPITPANASSIFFRINNSEIGSTHNYSITSDGGGGSVTGSGTVTTSDYNVSGINVSGLADGTLTVSVTLTDAAGNLSAPVTGTAVKTSDVTAPSGYSVTLDQDPVVPANNTAVSFTFAGAEIGAAYSYSVTSDGGAGTVTGNGTISTATDQITGINVSTLPDGTLTLSATLTDDAGNAGAAATDTATKVSDVTGPSVVTATAPDGRTYGVGENLDFVLEFDEPVIVTGVPQIRVAMGGQDRFANYLSGSGTDTLTFRYTIQAGDTDGNGISANLLLANGGTLKDATGNDATLTFSYANNSDLADTRVDTAAPSGYGVSFDQTVLNQSSSASASFTFSGAEVGTTYNYAVSSSGGAGMVTGSGTITTATDQLSNINLSSLPAGTLTLSVTLTDSVNNIGSAATDTIIKDTTAPALDAFARKTPTDVVTAADTLVFDIVFSEPVTNVAASDFTVDGTTGTGVLAGSDAAYTLTVSGGDLANLNGTVSLDLKTGHGITDVAGNALPDAEPTTDEAYTLSNDVDAPVLTVTVASNNMDTTVAKVGDVITVSITANEALVSAPNVSIAGQAVTVGGSGANWSGTLTVSGATPEGSVAINVSNAQDAAGNIAVALTATTDSSAVSVDRTAPTVGIASGATDPVSGAFTATFTFSEDVTGFAQGDIAVGNGAASGFAVTSASVYTATITPAGDGAVTVDVAAAAARDSAGNGNTVAPQFSITNDGTAPMVTISSGATDPVSGAFTATFTFSENVTGFAQGDISVGNGAASNFASTSATVYTATITPVSDGSVTVDVASNVATDSAGNGNTAAPQFSIINDATLPTVAIATGETDPVSGAFTITVTFSEDVSGFALGDIMVGNGAASGFAVTSASVYTALITPAGDGAVTVDVAANAAEDGAGNGNVAAPQFLITNDETGPTVAITSAAPANVNGRFSVTLTFSEPVVGVGLDDLSLLNARADNLAGSDAVYTLDIIPAASGAVSLTVSAAGAQDRAGNDNSASAALTRQADLDAPTLVLASPAFERVNGPFDVSLTFSEPVTGFAPDDLTLDNASVSGFAGSDADYTLTLTPTRSGEISLSVAAGAAQDIAGNPSIAAPALTRLADLDQPTVVLTRQGAEQGTGAVNGPTTITVTFSEPVSGLGLDDVSVQNGRALNLQGRNERYSFDIVPAGDGAVSVSVGEGAARDRVGNVSAASNTLGFVFDGTAPTLALSSTSPAVVNGRFTLTVRASEAVFGLDAGDISVTNGSVAGLSGSGSTYEALIDPTGSGTVIISIAADAAQDAAGNGSLAPDTLSRSVDQDRPGVTLLSEAPSSVNGPFTVTMQFSEAVTGFAVTDLITTNASLSAFTGSEANYSVLVTANTEGEVSVSIPADVAQDVNGNLNTGSDVLSRTVDLSAPTVTLQTDVTVLTDSTFTLTASFASAVSGLESRDIVTDNAVVTDISGGPVVYVITLSAEQDGEITVSIPENAATDAAGNGNRASGTLTLLRDATGPALSLSTESDEVTGPFTVSFTFDEAVTDFVAADILVENGSLSSLSGSGTGYSAEITPTTVGAVSISVPAGAVEDAFGNGSEAQSLSVTANGGRPVVSLEITANPTNPDETGSRFSLSNPGSDPIFFLASADQPWVDVTPTSGQIGSLSDIEFSVALNERINDLAPGTYVATVTVQVDDGTGASAGKGRPGAPGQETNVTLLAEIPVTVEVEEPLSGLEIVIRTPGGLTGSERLSFASDLDLIDGLDVAANAGDVRLFTSELEAGTYRITQETPDGYRLDAISCAGDLDSGSVIDLTAGTLDIDVDAGETLTCTFSTVRDDAAIRIATQKAIRTFMARRADRVLSAVPDLSNRFTARESTDAGGLSATMNERGKRGAFETNLSGFRNRAAQNAVGDNAGLTKPVLEGWDMWVSAEYAEVDDERNDRGVDGEFFAAQLGFDYQLNPNLILGGLVQYDWMSESDKVLAEGVGATAGAQLSGDGFMVGPYFVWRASDALIIDGLGLWGRTDNRVNPLGFYEDDFETKRFLIQANVTGEIEAGSLRLRPQMTLSHYEDRQDAYIDSLGIDIPSQTVSIGRLRAGPELVWQQRTRTGTLIEWGGSLRAVWDYNGPGRFDDQGRLSGGSEPIRADGTLSVALRLSNGIYLRGEAGLAGLGQGGFEARSGRLELIIPFGKGASSNTSRPGVNSDTNSLIQALTACDTGFGGDSASNIHQTGCPKSDRGHNTFAALQ